MAANLFECSICNYNFDSGNRKPLCLMCGHTFCMTCIQMLESSTVKLCPNCNKRITVPAAKLPVNYLVIPSEDIITPDLCEFHGHELEYFCVQCRSAECKKCAKESHENHRIELMEDFMDFEDQVTDVIVNICQVLEDKKARLHSAIAVQNEALNLIGIARSWKYELSEGKNELNNTRESVTKDLDTWQGQSAHVFISAGKKRHIFRNLLSRYKSFLAQDQEKSELEKVSEKLKEIQEEAGAIQLRIDEQLSTAERSTSKEPIKIRISTSGSRIAYDVDERLNQTEPLAAGSLQQAILGNFDAPLLDNSGRHQRFASTSAASNSARDEPEIISFKRPRTCK